MPSDALTVSGLTARAVNVPMARPLVVSSGSVTKAPLVLIDLETAEGVTGRAYLFCYGAYALGATVKLLDEFGAMIEGEPLVPLALEDMLQRRVRLLAMQGLTAMAIAGIDMAAWDAVAKAADLPLVRLLGGAARPIPAYNSNGLGIIGPDKAAEEAEALVEPGFSAVKVRLGYDDVELDAAVVDAVMDAVGDGIAVMSDYNQSLAPAAAQQRIRELDDIGLAWIEEPTRADDYAGNASITEFAATPIQIGENFWGPHDLAKAIEAGAADYYMPDVMKIGGVTGWMRAVSLAEPHGIPISSHLFPEISAHLLAATPNAHWLEYVDWANPILADPIAIENGRAIIPDVAGAGISWNEGAVERFAVTA